MSTTAKQLIEAAKRLREKYSDWKYVEAGSLYGRDVIMSCAHILSTVREDDDEPVTRERMKSEPGWAEHPDYPWRFDHAITGCVVVSETNSRWKLVEPHRILKSMGHLRRLVAALGE